MAYSALIIAYLLGSLSFAVIVSRFFKIDDPRNYGSRNAGATNVMRSGNKKAAAFTLLGDLLKGAIVVWVAKYYLGRVGLGMDIVAFCGIAVVLGHVYPIFFKFQGGKGVATAIGVMLGFNLWLAICLVLTWTIIFKVFKISSLAALIATALSPVYAYFIMGNSAYFGAVLVIALIVLYKHKGNIVRLISGQEDHFKKSR